MSANHSHMTRRYCFLQPWRNNSTQVYFRQIITNINESHCYVLVINSCAYIENYEIRIQLNFYSTYDIPIWFLESTINLALGKPAWKTSNSHQSLWSAAWAVNKNDEPDIHPHKCAYRYDGAPDTAVWGVDLQVSADVVSVDVLTGYYYAGKYTQT